MEFQRTGTAKLSAIIQQKLVVLPTEGQVLRRRGASRRMPGGPRSEQQAAAPPSGRLAEDLVRRFGRMRCERLTTPAHGAMVDQVSSVTCPIGADRGQAVDGPARNDRSPFVSPFVAWRPMG